MAPLSKRIAYAILEHLNSEKDSLSEEGKESIDIAMQCISETYGIDMGTDRDLSLNPITLASLIGDNTNNSTQQSENDPKKKAEEYKAIGNGHMATKSWSKARDEYTKAIDLDDTNAIYFSNRACALSHMGDHETALEDCKKAIEIDPKYAKAYSRMGLALLGLGRQRQAISYYKQAIEIEPENKSFKMALENAMNLKQEKGKGSAKGDGTENSAGDLPDLAKNMNGFGDLMNNPQFAGMAKNLLSGGGGGLDALMKNPEIMAAGRKMMEKMGGQTDPSKLLNNPEIVGMAQNIMKNNPDLLKSFTGGSGSDDGASGSNTIG